jgi:tyrosine-protein phosphatase SIW14
METGLPVACRSSSQSRDYCICIKMRKLWLGILCVLFASAPPVLPARPLHGRAPRTASTSFGEKLTVTGIHNFGKISDQLYRGGQPRSGSVEQLKKLGVTTIVDLRGEDPSERDHEKRDADALGIQFVSIPVSGWKAPTQAQVTQFLSILADPKQKVFVHCHFGEDRTGVFVATYRIAVQQWSAEQAIQEMRFGGFNAFWHHTMTAFVQQFPTVLSSSPAFAASRYSNSLNPTVAASNTP